MGKAVLCGKCKVKHSRLVGNRCPIFKAMATNIPAPETAAQQQQSPGTSQERVNNNNSANGDPGKNISKEVSNAQLLEHLQMISLE